MCYINKCTPYKLAVIADLYSKAKVENRIKLMQSHQIEISKEDFNENSLGGITNG